jgi:hypothetical protein
VQFSKEEMQVDAAHIDASRPTAPRSMRVLLDADVADVFPDSESVNHALRKLIEAVPARNKGSRRSA